jgi:hypothetical protein
VERRRLTNDRLDDLDGGDKRVPAKGGCGKVEVGVRRRRVERVDVRREGKPGRVGVSSVMSMQECHVPDEKAPFGEATVDALGSLDGDHARVRLACVAYMRQQLVLLPLLLPVLTFDNFGINAQLGAQQGPAVPSLVVALGGMGVG